MSDVNATYAQQNVILVCPFRHDLGRTVPAAEFEPLNRRWRPWWSRLGDRDLARSLDDTYFLLPHVRRALFPETAFLPEAQPDMQLAAARQLADSPISTVAARISPDTVLRMTLAPEESAGFGGADLQAPVVDDEAGGSFAAPVKFHWIDAVLFPQQVGFLVLSVELDEAEPSHERLRDFLYYARLIHPPSLGWKLARWKLSDHVEVTSQELVDYLLEGLAVGTSGPRSWDEFLEGDDTSESRRRFSMTNFGSIYSDAFYAYTYCCLAHADPHDGSEGTHRLPSSPFSSENQRRLFELATAIDTQDRDYVPHPRYVDELFDKHELAFWQNWQGMALERNVAFLGRYPDGFASTALRHNVENDYFILYLLTLFQKCRLSVMFGELMRQDRDLQKDVRHARKVFSDYLRFQNTYWYNEPSRKPLGIAIYQAIQRGLGVVHIYEEISDKVRQLREYYENRYQRRIGKILNIFTFLALPGGLVIQLYWMLNGNASDRGPTDVLPYVMGLVISLLGGYTAAGLIWLLWLRFRSD